MNLQLFRKSEIFFFGEKNMLISKRKQFYYCGVHGEFVYGCPLKHISMLEMIDGR